MVNVVCSKRNLAFLKRKEIFTFLCWGVQEKEREASEGERVCCCSCVCLFPKESCKLREACVCQTAKLYCDCLLARLVCVSLTGGRLAFISSSSILLLLLLQLLWHSLLLSSSLFIITCFGHNASSSCEQLLETLPILPSLIFKGKRKEKETLAKKGKICSREREKTLPNGEGFEAFQTS